MGAVYKRKLVFMCSFLASHDQCGHIIVASSPPQPDKPPPNTPHKSATAIPLCSRLPVDG
jgi:hypothetical protein